MYRTVQLDHETFERFWPQIQEMMDTVPDTWNSVHTKDEIEFRVLNDTIQVWGVCDEDIRMVLFTQVACFATGKTLQLIWAAGEGDLEDKVEALEEALVPFAKAQRCKEIDIIGRFGWERVLSRRGFKKSAVILSRKVVHEGIH